MRQAISLAHDALTSADGAPIGCVIVREGTILASGHNEVTLRCDATAHAEIVAIRRAGARLDTAELVGATLYSTLQPCGMCTMAAIWSRIGRIVYGAGRADVHRHYFEDRHLDTLDFIADAYAAKIALAGGVLVRQCAALYDPPDS